MSEPVNPDAARAEEEPLDGVVVLAQEPRDGRELVAPSLKPAVQAAAAAAGGVIAGAALIGLVHRRQRRRLARGARPAALRLLRRSSAQPARELFDIVGTRSLLVDIHLLAGPGGQR